ncbi:MAG: PEP-CTERM sorting domain-containing protein [Sphingomonadales bacterium]|nr:PEP-CTERM sorting domain-containing protein [Sphingomonadales bacterium]
MKRIFTIAATVSALAGATQAHATDFILTSDILNHAQAKHFYIDSSTATSVNANLGNTVNTGSFTDYYFFSPLVASVGSGSSTSSATNFQFGNGGGLNAISITSFSLADLSATLAGEFVNAFTTNSASTYLSNSLDIGNWVRSNSGLAINTWTANTDIGNLRQAHIDGVPLAAGDFYVIKIQGTAAVNNSNYTGTLNSTSVPEPATWAMMLVGFGAVGFAMRRRQEQAKVRFAF